ncbi:arylsulfatase [Membranihabitans maritimus]|uniref:arylsulfatase n=1 Tax=Membranihabitans maritimus TaxID=2904244 RepID=UPI001F475FD8|nr:arylsulfatase [Membranihabitans maritimus]
MRFYDLKTILFSILVMYSNVILGKTTKILSDTTKPNIIVIMADDLGFSDLGCYGSEIKTPNLDRLAYNGLRFTQFYNCGRCFPTRASLISGYYPEQINMGDNRSDFPKWGYLLPHHLEQAGYKSYHSGKWHVGNVPKLIDDAGFDRSYHTETYNNHFAGINHYLDDEELPLDSSKNYYSTTAITDYAIDFLSEHESKYAEVPFFLYLAYITPHFPLQAPQEDIDKYRQRYLDGWDELKSIRYQKQKELGLNVGDNSPFEYLVTAPWSWPLKWLQDTIPGEIRLAKPWEQLTGQQQYLQATKMAIHAAMIDRIDQEIGRLLAQLDTDGKLENTIILFLSDNGASAEQIVRGNGHNKNAPPGSNETYLCLGPGFSTASNTPFRRHKYWTHEGGITTPLIIYWENKIDDPGGIRSSTGHIIDFLPTFLDLAGIPPLQERNDIKAPMLPGKSLVPLFEKDEERNREIYFSHQGNKALRQGKWKAVISTDIDARWQLYNMEEDRTELNNLADKFYNFGNPSWKEEHMNRLDKMKTRWYELDSLYNVQGDIHSP